MLQTMTITDCIKNNSVVPRSATNKKTNQETPFLGKMRFVTFMFFKQLFGRKTWKRIPVL